MDQPDQLRELFRMQKSLNERIGVHTDAMTDEQKMVLWKAPKKFHFRERSYWPVIYRQQTSRAASNNAKHAVVARDKYIEIDLGPGIPRLVLAEHRGIVKQMQFSFDSRYLASLSWNTGACVLWQFEGNPNN